MVQLLEQQEYEVERGDRLGNIPNPVDYVFDIAAYGNYYDQTDENEAWNINLHRVRYMLEQLDEIDYKAAVFTGTSAVYLKTKTPYIASKSKMETIVAVKRQRDDAPLATIRPYTIYGVGDTKHLIPIVFDSCINQTPMILDPKPIHDYVWVEDVAQAYITVAKDIKERKACAVEVGTGIGTSNEDVVHMIEEITGKKANITGHKKLRHYDENNKDREYYWSMREGVDTDIKSTYKLMDGLKEIYEKQGFEKKDN